MALITRTLIIIMIICQLTTPTAIAADANFGILYSPSTITFGNPLPVKPLAQKRLRLLVWNIYKANDPRVIEHFSELSSEADIALIQEIVSYRSFLQSWVTANPHFAWTMAKSFQQLDYSFTGVANAARSKALRHYALTSKAKEPVVNTPKATLISEYALENSTETLLVANIHSLNFVSLESYRSQIHQLIEKILLHKGPLIIAGDFNTWDPARMHLLRSTFASFQLVRVPTPISSILSLDHIFVRGFKTEFVFNLNDINSSDHAPLMVDLVFESTKK